MPVRNENILPTVIVVIHKPGAPGEKGNRRITQPGSVRDLAEIGVAVVVPQRLVVIRERCGE